MVEVKFCENNFTHGTEETVKKLKKKSGEVEVIVESCLGYCGDCATLPYALVNDEYIEAQTPDELYEKIVELL